MTDLKHQQSFLLRTRPKAHAAGSAASLECGPDIQLLDSAEAMTPFIGALDELAAASTDGNPLFEAATLAAAMTHLQSGGPVNVALVWKTGADDAARLLIGAFPYQARRFYLGLPISVWSIWTHIHSFIATPLVRAGHERDAIRSFMNFADRSGAPLMRFPLFQADGAFGPALAEVLGERGRATVETGSHERAFLKSDLDGEAYLAAHMRKKKRKEYNRLWNRLAEAGELKFETLDRDFNLGQWLDQFFALERSGWKGKRGTALAERDNERDFFEVMCRKAHEAGKFHAAQITLDGKPLAMLASFISGGGAFSFKIAFDEDYARYSPGALLMMKVIGAFHDDARIAWVDSCAIPNHPMIDHIWAERRAMREVNAATAHMLSPYLIAYSSDMTGAVERAWAAMRKLYHRLRKEVERD